LVVYATNVASPAQVTGPIDERTLRATFLINGISGLGIGSALWLVAQRLASARARELILRDPRPPVLYLRSFGDDRLKIRIATYGSASFIERLSPRRFAPFEQIVARHLADAGPVIAVNRPGTRLPQLGAARESLSDDEWRQQVDRWIDQASWIVICAAPRRLSPGFAWELELLAKRSLWPKTIQVLPPVRDADMRERWELYQASLARAGASPPIPADPAAVMALRRQQAGGWVAYTGERRDEWSYAAALQSAIAGPAGVSGDPR
jgi:hypothetical protein